MNVLGTWKLQGLSTPKEHSAVLTFDQYFKIYLVAP